MTSDPRVVLVTGASSGIGKAAALGAARRGDHVVLVARGPAALEAVAVECRTEGAATVTTAPTDLGDDSAVRACVATVLDRHGRIDGVIHSAGVVAYGRTEDVPAEVFDGVLRTNLTGSVNLARHVIPVLRRQEHGSVVMIGSVIGHIAVPSMSPYVLSKWGVRALARQLHLENRDLKHVHVSYLAPGGVDTPIYEQAANYDGYVGRPPPPVSSPEKIARAALRRLDRPRPRTQVGIGNNVMRFGFTTMPAVFDLLVDPLFRVAATDRTTRVSPNPGNVLASREGGNASRGAQGNAFIGIGRNLVAVVRQAAGGKAA